ncbi:hypothetical protein LJB42_000615 [Komagataella kurtzmanii]|nr:hypothetical protein LJB42_000615 [Komagataella kurtzmanii]
MSGDDDIGSSSESEIEGGLSLLSNSRLIKDSKPSPPETTPFNDAEIISKYSDDKLIKDLSKYQSNQETLSYIASKAKQRQDVFNKRSNLEEKIRAQVNPEVFKENPAYLDYLVTHYEGKHGINLQDFFFVTNPQPFVILPIEGVGKIPSDQLLNHLAYETREEFIDTIGAKLDDVHDISLFQCKTFLKTIGCKTELIDQPSSITLTLNPHVKSIPQSLIVRKVWYLIQRVSRSPWDLTIQNLLLYTVLYFFMDKLIADGSENTSCVDWLNKSMISLMQWYPSDTQLTTNESFQETMSLLISAINKITTDVNLIARFLLNMDTGNSISRYMCHALSMHYLSVPIEYQSVNYSMERIKLDCDPESINREILRLLEKNLEKFCHCELEMSIPKDKLVYKQIQAKILSQDYFHMHKSQINPTIFETINSLKALEDKLFDKILQSNN